MISHGTLVRLEARPGRNAEVEELLRSVRPMVGEEPGTAAWFGVKFGRLDYGIFDVFPDEEARDAHIQGPVAQALSERGGDLFTAPPKFEKLHVLAHKLPPQAPDAVDAKAILLTFKSKIGHQRDVEHFLRGAESIVQEEPGTTAWFAFHLFSGDYGIFDVFPDKGARFSHLTGHVPRELAKQAFSLLGSVPDLELMDVMQEKLN
jgi:quinol monooxygenase YgiN